MSAKVSSNGSLAQSAERPERDLSLRIAGGLSVVALLAFAIGGWAATAELSGAVIAPGQVVVESNVKKVQHPTGGVVGEIRVKSGDYVHAGDIVLRLDDTQTRANLGIVLSQLNELIGRKSRLAAERDDAEAVVFPAGFGAFKGDDGGDEYRIVAGERRLFEQERATAMAKKSQLRSRIGQLESEIKGLNQQEKAKARERELVQEEIDRLEILQKKKLLPATRMLAMQRDQSRIEGEHGALIAQIARINGQITEVELQILEIDETAKSEAQRELRDIEARIGELMERRIAAEDMLRRVELRAPRSGYIHELAVSTVGGVVNPGDTVMAIVPEEDKRTVEVRLMPHDIDQVTVGQHAVLRFPAFNQRTTPEIAGKISRLAADVSHDPQTGMSFYTARVSVTDDELKKLGSLTLLPGMPVESMIQTGQRTALSYFTKPIADNLARTFKEE
ncbi:MAG: HlyD family type I secretion periplasmic adaptor subunit [Hyphomicrobium sp.]|nr:HlyD family type I secretion periplasmic adaptor subunit [Hyphomicrobium sp.]